jgi:nicotinamidase-related amidase
MSHAFNSLDLRSFCYSVLMRLPDSDRKKALIVVDLQPAFIKDHNSHIVPKVKALLERVAYDAYVEAVFSAEKDSLWDVQQKWICPEDEETHTVDEIRELLASKKPLRVHKHTRSAFRGNQDVAAFLEEKGIEEVHLVGTETNDCVLATAFDAFDSGYPVYVLEECCESATPGRHQMGLDLLRLQGMTNNRCLANTVEIAL